MQPGTVASITPAAAFLLIGFAALTLWNWWHWRER